MSDKQHHVKFPCGLCENDSFSVIFSGTDRFQQDLKLVVCDKCGLQQLNPRMDADQLEDFYASEYYKLYGMDVKKESNPKWVKGKNKVAKGILDVVESHRSLEKKKLLDIGCGHGFLLHQAQSRECDVFGVEASVKNARELKKKGFHIFEGSFQSYIKSEKEEFDIVTLSHILEHIGDIKQFLEDVRNCISTGGVLCVAVPNVNWQTSFGTYPISAHTAHVYYFSEDTLKALLEACGFKVVSISSGKGGAHLRMVCIVNSRKKIDKFRFPLDDPEDVIARTTVALKRRQGLFINRLARRAIREALMILKP